MVAELVFLAAVQDLHRWREATMVGEAQAAAVASVMLSVLAQATAEQQQQWRAAV